MNARTIGGAVAVAILSVLTWFAWLSWDYGYQTSEAGNISGPYHAWQVVACGATLLVLLVGAVLLRVHPAVAAAALTLAFTAVWFWWAGSEDETGLFMVGALALLVGLGAVSVVLAFVTRAIAARGRPRTP